MYVLYMFIEWYSHVCGIFACTHKINMVFDNLRATANFNGYVLFLEEDHYVAPDFVVMANQLIELKKTRCPECDFVNLGMYNKVKNYHGISIKVSGY